jgi:hypothetical protein
MAQAPGPNTQGQVEGIDDGEVVGGIKAVVVHPTNAGIVYVGAVNGGIWKTENGMDPAPVWQHQTDDQKSLSIGALEFDPTDPTGQTLVAGTGCFSSFGSCGADARSGLLRTTDGGASWKAIDGEGTLKGLNIAGVSPRGGIIVIAVNTANDPADRGIWRSPDTGASWTQISGRRGTGLPPGAAYDLASDPLDPNRLLTNAGNRGLYRSIDAGATWTKVSNTAMDALMARVENVKISVGRDHNVFVAVAVVVPIAEIPDASRLAGVFHSANGVNGWAAMDLPATVEHKGISQGIHPGAQGGIHLSIAADHNNSQIVYIGGDRQPCFTEELGCSQDGASGSPPPPPWPNSIGAMDFSGRLFRGDASKPAGHQWVSLTHANTSVAGGGTGRGSAPHADSRAMVVAANGALIEADDGGVYRRTDPQTNRGDWFSMNGNIQATEFHAIAWDANSHLAIGSAQDTGTPVQRLRSNVRWRSVSTGDGGDVAVDDLSSPGLSTRYSSAQSLLGFQREVYDASNVRQSRELLALTNLSNPDGKHPLQAQFYTPIKLNTVSSTRLIIGAANSVYESLDQGDTITKVEPDLTVNDSPDIIAYGALGNPDILYVGSGKQVFIRRAANPEPLQASTSYPGTDLIRGIAIDPNDPKAAYVLDASRVFRTTTMGDNWMEITGDLPSLDPGELHSIAYLTNSPAGAVLVGGDTGVFEARGASFSSWSRLGSGLPRAPVRHLQYSSKDQLLLAGTLGRGAWTLAFSPSPSPLRARMDNAPALRPAIALVKYEQQAAPERAPGEQTPAGSNAFELRSGVVIDPVQQRAYIMSPSGGIDAVELKNGERVWSTRAAAKPLGLVDQRLISQAEVPNAANKLKVVILNPATGNPKAGSDVSMPAGVQPSIKPLGGKFDATARAAGGEAVVTWEFQKQPLRGLRPGTEEKLSLPKGGAARPAPTENAESSQRGAFRLNLSTGAPSAAPEGESTPAPKSQPSLLPASERLPGLPETQVLSADGRHILVSRRTSDDRVWEKYTLAIYERGTGKWMGELKSHFSVVPFFVTDSHIIFETRPYARNTEAGPVEEPLKIRAVDLKTGQELWNREVRDLTYRGSFPP